MRADEIVRDILIPRYYDPRIAEDLENLRPTHHLMVLKDLIQSGQVMHSHGDYVPKIYYGTGPYPYIRTSDFANWEIKASPKHGLVSWVYEEYSENQNVTPGDIMFVHEGTYLIGSVAMVTELDGPFVYQHHIAKFSVLPQAPFSAFFLLVALEAPEVHRQIRSKQFSADIIDSVVGRLEEIVIPVPRDQRRLRRIQRSAEDAVHVRARLREQIAYAADGIDAWLRGERSDLEAILGWSPSATEERRPTFLGERRGFSAAALPARAIVADVLLPKYYDPAVRQVSAAYEARCDLTVLGDLIDAGEVEIHTGDEIGRLNYGTGDIPFVRTSDFGSWELKREAKQGVSQEVYDKWSGRQNVRAGDILLVRDGTYLVGTTVVVQPGDLPLLICGGIYKLRCKGRGRISGALLFALLNTPFLRRQIRNKQFTRDVIDTLGHRVRELLLPIPKDEAASRRIASFFDDALRRRFAMRKSLHQLTGALYKRGPVAR